MVSMRHLAMHVIRPERPQDIPGIRDVNLKAFDTPLEANLVDGLRVQADPIVSLVAIDGDVVVGHILFAPVTLQSDPNVRIMGLAPMAVSPDRQRHGIGSALVREGLDMCERLGAVAVVVLGHRDYYPRFGFVPASKFGLRSEYDVPDDAFMALEVTPGALRNATGTVRYHALFAAD
jgi:putative acetyltransferase